MGNGFDIHGDPANETIIADLIKAGKIRVHMSCIPPEPIQVTDPDLRHVIENLSGGKHLLAFGCRGDCHVRVEKN